MSIRINLEIGHEASLRTKRTPEGFTHDWEVFVRGCDKADIHTYVEKVVFNLHETFPRPKRIVKDPPYSVKESGYAGFTFPIDIYLKNRDEPKVITFDYDLQLQPSGPSISNVQKEKYVFSAIPDDFKHKLLKGGGIIVSLSAQDSAQDTRASEEKNQLYNKPNFGSSSDSGKKHKGGSKGPQSQLPNEPRPSSDFVDLFGDLIFKTNQTTVGGDPNKGLDGGKGDKIDRGDKDGGGRSIKDKLSDKDKSKSKSSPNITKDRDKDKSTKQDKPTISEPTERNKKDDKRSNKDRVREKQRDRSKEEKPSNSSNSKRDKSPIRPKSPSPITKRSFSPKRRTATPSPSPKRPPSPIPIPAQKQHRDKSEKRSNDSSTKDKDRLKEDRKRDKKDKRDKEHKENKHKDKEHRSKDVALKKDKEVVKEPVVIPTAPIVTAKVDKKDKSNRDKEKEVKEPPVSDRVAQTPPTIVIAEKTREKTLEQSTSSKIAPPVEQIIVDKPSKHKHKKKDKDKKQKSSSTRPDRDDKKDKEASSKDSRKDKKEKINKLSIDQFIAEPKSNSFNRSPKNTDDPPPKGRSKSIIDDDSSNSSLEDVPDDRFSRDKSVEKLIETKVEKHAIIPPEPPKKSKPPAQPEVALSQRKDKPQKPKKEKRQQQQQQQQTQNIITEQQTDDDNLDGSSSKKKKKRKVTDSLKPNHNKADSLNDSSDVDLNKSETASEINEPPEKIAREDVKEPKEKEAPSSNGKTLNATTNNKKDSKEISKEVSITKEEITDDAEDYLKILRELQTKIMSLQDNMELQRVVQLIAETGRYEVSDRTFDFDLCLLDRSTVRQLQEFFANLAT